MKMFVKPRTGLVVRDPDTKQPLPAEGRDVPASAWWTRRLTSGDVVRVEPMKQEPAAPAEEFES